MTMFLFSCGKDYINMRLSGQLNLDSVEEKTGPTFIALSRTDDMDEIEANPEDNLIMFSRVDPDDNSFDIDLSDAGVKPGEEIVIFGFVDNDYINSFPNPTDGDYVGFYFKQEDFESRYKLKEGMNEGIDIKINRKVYDFDDAEVAGTIYGDYEGDVIVIAFAGELNSLDFDDFDIDGVVGFKRLTKGSSPLSYKLSIMPYGYNVPIENVYLFVLYDSNGNEKPDAGDKLGFYSIDEEHGLPTLITINDTITKNKNIDITMDVPEPSGYDIPLYVDIELPTGNGYNMVSDPIFLIIAYSENEDPNDIIDYPIDSVKYFQKIEAPEIGTTVLTDIKIDLSETDMKAGDKVFVTAMLYKDYSGGFSFPEKGDFLGFFIDTKTYSPTFTLQEDVNEKIFFKISRSVYSFDSTVSGTIFGCGEGEVIFAAYCGDIKSFDFTEEGAINFDDIIGYEKVTKTTGRDHPMEYTMSIFPYGHDSPVEDVIVFAFLDNNKNGMPDGGDLMGFHTEDTALHSNKIKDLPKPITINDGENNFKNIKMLLDMPVPSGNNMSITGNFTKPEGFDENAKAFIAVIKPINDDLNLIFTTLLQTLKQFSILPPGENNFNIDLSNTDLVPGDEIFLVAIWDKEFTVGFPDPGPGDKIGMLWNKTSLNLSLKLEEGVNTAPPEGYEFKMNKDWHNHNSSIIFQLKQKYLINGIPDSDYSETDNAIIIAMHKNGINITSFSFDIDYIIGICFIENLYFNQPYEMPILPIIFDEMVVNPDFQIDDITLVAIHDKDGSGIPPDSYERIGMYKDRLELLPNYFNIINGSNTVEKYIWFTDFTIGLFLR